MLRLNDDGFEIVRANQSTMMASLRWRDVRAIRTYKRDLFSYDTICLAFQIDDGSWVEIVEDNDGFMKVARRMREVFPCIPERWYSDVMLPAFAMNDTLLWRRDDRSGEWAD